MKPVHPAAELFPLMDDEALAGLAADIKANGQREAIWLDKSGRILDGRNRAVACELVGVFPAYQTWDGNGSPVTFVLSLNLHRRHMSQSQKAMVAVKVEEQLAAEAKKRQARAAAATNAAKGREADETLMEIVPEASEPPAREQAGDLVGVSGRYVQDAKTLKEDAPDLAAEVAAGAITLPKALKAAAKRKAKSAPPAEELTPEQQYEADLAAADERAVRALEQLTDVWPYFRTYHRGDRRSEVEALMVDCTIDALAEIEEMLK